MPLPEFDFNDSIQGHERFDSLVETEVFLGIESNEDNQWIEDFSRGASGVEFSTSAAEDCCILRRNNVWSEATSSESVEMLLKSVGQEDITPSEARTEESNAYDKFKQMEPNIKHGNKSFSEMENIMNLSPTPTPHESNVEFLGVMESTIRHCDNQFSEMERVMNLEPTSIPDEIHENFSALQEDTGGEIPLDVSSTENHDGSLIPVDSTMSCKDSGLPKGEGFQSTDWNSHMFVQSKVDSSVETPLQENEWEDTCASGNPIDVIASSTQNLTVHSFELNSEQVKHQIRIESSDGSQTVNSKHEDESGSMKEVQSDDLNTVISPSLVKAVEEKVDAGITNKEHSNVISKGIYESHEAEEHNEIIYSEVSAESGRFDDKMMWKSRESGDQSEVSVVPVFSKGEATFDNQTVEVQVTHIGTEICASQESKINSVVSMTCANTVVEERDGSQLNSDMMVIEASSSLSIRENNEVTRGEECSSSPVRESSSLPPICSAGLAEETCATATLRGEHDASGVVIENLKAEVVKAVILDEPAKICEDTIQHGQDNLCGLEVSVREKESMRLTYESISSDYQVDEGGQSTTSGEPRTENNSVVCSIGCDETDSKDTVPNIYLDDPSVTMSGSLSIGDGVIIDKHINENKDQVLNSEVECSPLNKKEESMAEVSAKENLSTLLDSSELEARSCPISYAADVTSIAIGEKILSDRANHSMHQKENCDIEAQSEPEAAVSNGVSKNCTKDMDVIPVPSELMAKVGDSGDVLPDLKQVQSNDQMPKQSMTSPSQEIQESNGKIDQEANQTVSASEGKNSGLAVSTVIDANSDCGTNKDFSFCAPFSQTIVQESADCTISGKPTSLNGAEILSNLEYENKFSKGPSMQSLLLSETTDMTALNDWSNSHDIKKSSAPENEKSLPLQPTLLKDLSNVDSSMDRQPFPAISADGVSPIGDGSLSTSALGLIDPQDATHGSPQASDIEAVHGHQKGSTERKNRRTTTKGTRKELTKKVNTPKTVKSLKQSERGDKSSNLPSSPGVFHLMHSKESDHHRHMESSSVKPFVFVASSTSSLPDLNSSASSSAMFQQPFTDLQQLELRAQIFVYGALIQGIAPDEAYMLAAFGGPECGKRLWENAWRSCIERAHGQKSYPISSETFLPSDSGSKSIDHAIKQSTPQSKVISSVVGRVSSKGTAAVVNPMIPPSSPLWNISTPSEALHSVVPRGSVMEYQQSLSPLYPYQTQPMRNFIGLSSSWLSQAPFRSPWVTTPQTSAPEVSARLSALPVTEPVHLTPLKEPFIQQSPGLKLPGPRVHSSIPSTLFSGPSPLFDTKRTSVIQQGSSDPKPRKRKKFHVLEDPSQITVHSLPQLERLSFPTIVHSQSTAVPISTSSNFSSKEASEKSILHASPMPFSADLKKIGQDVEQKGILSEETLGKVKEARQQAEDASIFASEAVQHGQEIWKLLDRQNNSGMESDVQTKISSAAIAIVAAVAVAKAAAAAAKVASNAALQAKLMADEALASMGYEGSAHNSVGKGNSSSKLRGEGGKNSSSVIFDAKEAARHRVEATTAASKQAENIDAIVKAAELAAEAVSQAGKIVSMGEPLPLSELVKLGPDGCLKVPQLSNELVIREDERQLRVDSFGHCGNLSAKASKGGPFMSNASWATLGVRSPIRGVISNDLMEDQRKFVDCVADTGILSEDDMRGNGRKVSDLAKTIGVSEFEARSTQSTYEKVKGVKDDNINEGSFVEILKDRNGSKAAWFTASVLSLKDGKEAYVCYNELKQEDGSGPLKEWVPIESLEDQGPKIRISRPVTAKQYEGTRKRRRETLNGHAWSFGDRVDAWVQDSWWEGVVTEKDQKDGTTITVHLPAKGETLAVKIWHLRPSLIWKDGKWVEWSLDRGNDNPLESDMPREKRLKVGSPSVKAKGEDSISKLPKVVESGIENSRLLGLSANERAFNVGRTAQNESKLYPLRTVRTGLQEGSRVIFGVPKPGKKRKFMDVSKHYVANHNKGTETSDSVNFVKYLMPQGSGPRRLKNRPKPEMMGKRASETKPEGSNKSGKPPSVSGRTLPQRENYLTNAVSSSLDGSDSENHVDNTLGKNKTTESSSSGEASNSLIVFSSTDPSGEGPRKLERANKGKFAPVAGKLAKIEEDKVFNSHPTNFKSASDIEPRRSVRRIQPTSRLLEGIQSSLTILKNPSAQEKGTKKLVRPTSKANNN